MLKYQEENLTIFQSALYQTTSTLVNTKDCTIIVDPNWLPQEVEEIKSYIQPKKPLYIIFTHSDFDHLIGYGAFPNATTIAHKNLTTPEKITRVLQEIQEFDDQYYIERRYPVKYPEIDIKIATDGQQLMIGDTTMTFYLAPGHTDDSIFAVIEPQGILLVGDYLSNIEFPFIYHNSKSYEGTLRKIDDILNIHTIKYLIPGHGDYADSYKEIQKRRDDSLEYILYMARNTLPKEYFNRYPFPLSMIKAHELNLEQLEKELHERR